MRSLAPALLCLIVATEGVGAEIPPGLYRVAVQVTIPNVDVTNADFVTEICWRGPADPAMPLGPLGPGPLKDCPSMATRTPDGLTVQTRCTGPNAGFAKSVYQVTASGFQGTVQMNMGGKNMTVGEVHLAEHAGDC